MIISMYNTISDIFMADRRIKNERYKEYQARNKTVMVKHSFRRDILVKCIYNIDFFVTLGFESYKVKLLKIMENRLKN